MRTPSVTRSAVKSETSVDVVVQPWSRAPINPQPGTPSSGESSMRCTSSSARAQNRGSTLKSIDPRTTAKYHVVFDIDFTKTCNTPVRAVLDVVSLGGERVARDLNTGTVVVDIAVFDDRRGLAQVNGIGSECAVPDEPA